MTRKPVVIGLVLLVASSGPLRAADASVACQFGIVTAAHEILVFCGETIDAVSESRYQQLTRDFSQFMAANETSNKPRAAFNLTDQDSLSQLGKDRICAEREYPMFRLFFEHHVSDEGMAAIARLLSVPKDPFEGDCL
jgi:hypothetical protein